MGSGQIGVCGRGGLDGNSVAAPAASRRLSAERNPNGLYVETQSASHARLWHRDRPRDIRKLPQIGDVHRYLTGKSQNVLFVVFERNRLQGSLSRVWVSFAAIL